MPATIGGHSTALSSTKDKRTTKPISTTPPVESPGPCLCKVLVPRRCRPFSAHQDAAAAISVWPDEAEA